MPVTALVPETSVSTNSTIWATVYRDDNLCQTPEKVNGAKRRFGVSRAKQGSAPIRVRLYGSRLRGNQKAGRSATIDLAIAEAGPAWSRPLTRHPKGRSAYGPVRRRFQLFHQNPFSITVFQRLKLPNPSNQTIMAGILPEQHCLH